LSWAEVQDKFKGELTSRFIHELEKLKGHQFTSKYLQFAEFIMPKQQRIEGSSGVEDTEITVNITKTENQNVIVINDILSEHGLEIPDLPKKKVEDITEIKREDII